MIDNATLKEKYNLNSKELEDYIIRKYQEDENMMILIFAQWCVNNDLDPINIYVQAYPHQAKNEALQQVLNETFPKEQSDEISHSTLLNVLSAFGNDDLAFVVSEEIDKMIKKRV